jgi:hypothetical protein
MAYASRSGLFPGLGGVLRPVTFLVLQQQHHRIETRPSSLRHAFLHVRHRTGYQARLTFVERRLVAGMTSNRATAVRIAVRVSGAKALRARRTCPTCCLEKPYCIPLSRGECNDCAARWDQ